MMRKRHRASRSPGQHHSLEEASRTYPSVTDRVVINRMYRTIVVNTLSAREKFGEGSGEPVSNSDGTRLRGR